MPIIDLAVLITVGKHLGLGPTIGIVVVTALLGAHFCRSEGRKAIAGLRESLFQGRVVPSQIGDAILILIGGTMLLTPGFLTDLAGLAMILPFSRPLARRILFHLLPIRIEPIDLSMLARAGGVGRRPDAIREVDARVSNPED